MGADSAPSSHVPCTFLTLRAYVAVGSECVQAKPQPSTKPTRGRPVRRGLPVALLIAPARSSRRIGLVDRERRCCQRFAIEILRLFDGDAHEEDCAARELPWRLVALADRIAAVVSDTVPITGECELSRLGTHRSRGHYLIVDVEIRGSRDSWYWPARLPDELHAQRVLCRASALMRRNCCSGLIPRKLYSIVQLLVLDEERVAAKARSMGEDDTPAARIPQSRRRRGSCTIGRGC